MQTKDYTADLLPLIKALCGVEFSAIELPRIKSMVNRRAKRAYRASNYWTRFLRVGENRNVNDAIIQFDESGFTSIDTFLRIYQNPPFIGSGTLEYQFTVIPSGAKLLVQETNFGNAYVTYKAVLTDTYGDGTSGTTASIPDEWFEYLAHGTYADFLRAEGQQEKASLADQEAEMILQDELMRLDEQGTQAVISTRIFTHGNMSSRYGNGGIITRTITQTTPVSSIETEDGDTIITEG